MNYSENILPYLRGELTAAERLDFEQQLKADPALAAEVTSQQQSWQLLGELPARARQKAEIGSWIAEASAAESTAQVRRFSPVMRYASMAAVIIVLAALAYLLFPQTASPETLYADYYQPYTHSQTMGAGDATDSLFQRGVKAFKENKYEEAIRELQLIASDATQYGDARMLIGAAYMQQEKYGDAIPFFQEASQNALLADQAIWYKAWAHLMAGEKEVAKSLFQKIAASQGYKHQEAEKLVDKL
jgi:tetratricopeptide (TPR) repeat protein